MSTDLADRPELKPWLDKGYWPCPCTGYRLHPPSLEVCPSGQHHRPSKTVPATDQPKVAPVAPEPQKAVKGPNKTELEAKRLYCPPDARFEGMRFRMANGHAYSPDWVWFDGNGRLKCLEVKGSYKLGSYQRARLAFDQCRAEWPQADWIWAERKTDGTWKVT